MKPEKPINTMSEVYKLVQEEDHKGKNIALLHVNNVLFFYI